MDKDKVYPDTGRGAIQCLKDISTLRMRGAVADPDPIVSGVWRVRLPAYRPLRLAVVYLAGYPDPFGRKRTFNDFETGDEV